MIHTFVKGIDDFGKVAVNNTTGRYKLHYPRPRKNDILIFFYPKTNSVGLYQMTEETEYYYKEGFQYVEGLMHNIYQNKDTTEVMKGLIKNFPKLGHQINNKINEVIEKHFKNVTYVDH